MGSQGPVEDEGEVAGGVGVASFGMSGILRPGDLHLCVCVGAGAFGDGEIPRLCNGRITCTKTRLSTRAVPLQAKALLEVRDDLPADEAD